jgi:hypothetical protein
VLFQQTGAPADNTFAKLATISQNSLFKFKIG